MKVFVAIDPDICIGVGKCEELEPNAAIYPARGVVPVEGRSLVLLRRVG